MKKICENGIFIVKGTNEKENLYTLPIMQNPHSENVEFFDMKNLLEIHKNTTLDYKNIPRLWNEVYSGKKELEIFTQIIENTKKNGGKIHIQGITLKEEIDIVRTWYDQLGYYHTETNNYVIDFKNSPITIGVYDHNILYSTKEYLSLKEDIFFCPPPREPQHQKAIKSAINNGVISMLYSQNIQEKIFLSLIQKEKIPLFAMGNVYYSNFLHRGFLGKKREIVLEVI